MLEHQILAELYEDDGALRRGHRASSASILESDPLKVEPYRALYRLLPAQAVLRRGVVPGRRDGLHGQGRRGGERNSSRTTGRRACCRCTGRLTNEHWVKHLFHADENIYVSKIMEMIAPAALQAKIAQLQAQGKLPTLDPRFKQDPATSTVTFAKTFGWAAQVLGIPAPELYVRSDVPGSIVAVPAVPPASIAGQTVLTGFQPQELTFICGKHLAHVSRRALHPHAVPDSGGAHDHAVRRRDDRVPRTRRCRRTCSTQIQATAQELAKYMQPVQLEGLRIVVKRFLDEGAKANIKRWNQAVDLTACRAGLLVCGDLEIAKKIIGSRALSCPVISRRRRR